MATVADHIERAKDLQSFWRGRLQSLCANHHQSKRQAECGNRDWQPKMGCGPDGLPIDPKHPWNK